VKSLIAGAAAALGLALIPTTGAAVPAPEPTAAHQPTAEARANGITKAGEAFMGWRQEQQSTVAPGSQFGTAAVVYGIDVSSHQGNVNWSYWWG